MYCLAPIFCDAEDAVCIVCLPVHVMLKKRSINTYTLLSPEDSFFPLWLPVLVIPKKGV